MKLIIINGSTGTGKSTLSRSLSERYKLSYCLDVDDIRHSIQGFKEYREESRKISFAISLSIVETCLKQGIDVILDKMMYSNHDTFDGTLVLDNFISIGQEYSADIHEIILRADEQIVLDRLNVRGYEDGGLNTPEKAKRHWERIEGFMKTRQNSHIIDTTYSTPKEVLDNVVSLIGD